MQIGTLWVPKSVISASAIMSSSSLGGGGASFAGRLLIKSEFLVGCGKRNASKTIERPAEKKIAQID